MDKVSRPMQIALGATLVLALVWFVALRPKSEEATAPTPATPPPAAQPANKPDDGGTSLTERPADAQRAVDEANAKNSANEQKATATGSDSQPSGAAPKSSAQAGKQSAPKPKATPKVKGTAKSSDPSAAIIASAKRGNVEVVLFWDRNGSDDREVLKAVKAVNTRQGTVKVRAIGIKNVGKYTALTSDVRINVAPTIVILSPKLQALTITGFTDTAEIDGLVGAIARRS